MPYIVQDKRALVDPSIETLVCAIKAAGASSGLLNYVVTRLVFEAMDGTNYEEINRIVGVLGCVQQEFYRRVAAPYEDVKKAMHGDVSGFGSET